MSLRWLALILVSTACGSSQAEPEEPGPIQPSGVYVQPAPDAPGDSSGGSDRDAPEISRSKGKAGGIVVLWPRIVLPRGQGPEPSAEIVGVARRLQARLVEVAKRARPGVAIDVRPEPERVCPKTGCDAVAIGSLLAVAGKGCGIVAHVSDPGPSPMRLVSYAGSVRIEAASIPFREPVESAIGVTDYVPCATVLDDPAPSDADVEAAVRAARR